VQQPHSLVGTLVTTNFGTDSLVRTPKWVANWLAKIHCDPSTSDADRSAIAHHARNLPKTGCCLFGTSDENNPSFDGTTPLCECRYIKIAEELLNEYTQHPTLRWGQVSSLFNLPNETSGLLHSKHAQQQKLDHLVWAAQQATVPFVLETVAKWVKTNFTTPQPNAASTVGLVDGRDAARSFETWLVNTILTNHEVIRQHVNRQLANQQQNPNLYNIQVNRFETVSGGSNTTRAPWDITLQLQLVGPDPTQNTVFDIHINIKNVLGDQACNTGGKAMFDWVLLGDIRGTPTVIQSFAQAKHLLDNGDRLPANDYWFWVFEKTRNPDEPFGEVWISSLLSADPDKAFVYNPTQTFPGVQARFETAAKTREPLATAGESRLRFLRWQRSNHFMVLFELAQHFGPSDKINIEKMVSRENVSVEYLTSLRNALLEVNKQHKLR